MAKPYQSAGLTNRTCGKGFILTARLIENEWVFILYPNFNRGARPDERTFSKGLADTKLMLQTVAPKQQVWWIGDSEAECPPKEILAILAEHCKTHGIWTGNFPETEKSSQPSH